MKREITYEDPPLGDVQVIVDFLPSPDELSASNIVIEVTVPLKKETYDFFKDQAGDDPDSYEDLMRRVLEAYALKSQQMANTGTRSQ